MSRRVLPAKGTAGQLRGGVRPQGNPPSAFHLPSHCALEVRRLGSGAASRVPGLWGGGGRRANKPVARDVVARGPPSLPRANSLHVPWQEAEQEGPSQALPGATELRPLPACCGLHAWPGVAWREWPPCLSPSSPPLLWVRVSVCAVRRICLIRRAVFFSPITKLHFSLPRFLPAGPS